MVTVRVALGRDTAYDILIGAGLLDQAAAWLGAACPAARYAVISDEHVAPLYGERLVSRLRGAGLLADPFTIPAGERHKTRETWARLCDALLAVQFGRDGAVLALGGGVVGDVAGFVAATLLRGIPYVQIPTSLLAMVDSSVGGKTGVDAPAGKNLLGAFHQPRLVVADLTTLATLPADVFAAGLAEAVKHGVMADREYFEFLERDATAILTRDATALERVVRRSVEIKAAVVARDERDAGPRAMLNFGHTVAHAIEAVTAFAVSHGAAVAIGMVVEARLAEARGVGEPGLAERVARVLVRFGLPVTPPAGTRAESLLAAMRQDKKNRGSELRFALPARIGASAGDSGSGYTIAVPEAAVSGVLRT